MDGQIEDEVIEVFREAKVTVNRQPIKSSDIQAAHRIGKGGKFIRAALINGKNLKGSRKYGEGKQIVRKRLIYP